MSSTVTPYTREQLLNNIELYESEYEKYSNIPKPSPETRALAERFDAEFKRLYNMTKAAVTAETGAMFGRNHLSREMGCRAAARKLVGPLADDAQLACHQYDMYGEGKCLPSIQAKLDAFRKLLTQLEQDSTGFS